MESFLAQYMPVNAAAHGPGLDRLNAIVHWVMLVLLVGWGLYFIYALYKFRASKNPKASYTGTTSHLSTYSEVGVAVVEVVLLVAFSIPAWSDWVTPPPKSANPYEVRVVAEQFVWNVHYPGRDGVFGRVDVKLVDLTNPLGLDLNDPNAQDDILSINNLHLEVNRPVTIRLSSKDVIHSFGLPVMRVKQDAIPGIVFPVHFTPVKTNDETEQWEIACAQLCGLGHYKMRGFLKVQTKEKFEQFLAENAPVPVPAG